MLILIGIIIATLGAILVIQKNWLYILHVTWRRDLKSAIRFARLNYYLILWELKNMTVAKIFATVVEKQPHKIAFYFEDDIWTYKRIDEYSNQVANFFLNQGLQRGDCVSLMLESRPEYVCVWLGLNKIGVLTALINTNLTNDPLVHSINVANSRAIVFGSEFSATIKVISPKIKDLKQFQFHEKLESKERLLENALDLRKCLAEAPTTSVPEHVQLGNLKDRFLYIYTSGTTGLPKAAVITNIRYMVMVIGINSMVNIKDKDCIYDPLPLYHSAGGIVGTGQALLCGGTVVIRKKFSATNFWKDCVKYRCTIAQYIGETCRYLLTVSEKEKIKHNIRAMFGNGLKAQIWEQFVQRFEIKEIFEFYGATEGNSNLINIDSTVGAVGFIPFYAKFLYPVALLKCDDITGEPIMNKDGYYTACRVNEPGVLVGKISTLRAVSQFTGYADKEATEKKILKDVFKKGDMYFNTGDILMFDDFGYYYFKDRTGDTFRWKGENVSTCEVEAIISEIADLKDTVVYGVEVPGNEGRAGMAAIVDPSKSVDMEKLATGLKENLPSYAQPIFLRVIDSIPLTGTFKLIKRDLVREGYNINKTKDTIYFFDVKARKFNLLTEELYESIVNQKIKL